MSSPLLGTASAAGAIERISYTHDAMIDLIIGNPMISQGKIAQHFGYTEPWVSRIFNSDAFQARLHERKRDIIDPTLIMGFDEKLRALADQSLIIVMDKLAVTKNPETALKALELTTKALGYGARAVNQSSIVNNFVVALPPKAATAAEWVNKAHEQGVLAGSTQDLSDAIIIDVKVMSPDLMNLVNQD